MLDATRVLVHVEGLGSLPPPPPFIHICHQKSANLNVEFSGDGRGFEQIIATLICLKMAMQLWISLLVLPPNTMLMIRRVLGPANLSSVPSRANAGERAL